MSAAPPQTQPPIHTPLNLATKQIRLLQILKGDASSRICCTLKTYDVAATPYIALSYTWGSEEDSQIVCINGVEFRVRKNLFEFLVVARGSRDESLFWVDQICIDQGNVRERNHQVALMSHIYTTAHSVTAWLGSAGEDSNLALDLLVNLDELNLGTSSVSITAVPSLLHNMTPRVRNALQKLFRRAYWSRLWIVQELKLAKEVLVRCGTRKVLWKQIIATVGPLCEIDNSGLGIAIADVAMSSRSEVVGPATRTLFMDDRDRGFYRQYGDEGATQVYMMEQWFGKGRVAREEGTVQLLRSIFMYCEFECADIRDKVYGLVGLYTGETCPVEIDYAKSAVDVYWRIVHLGVGAKFLRPRWLDMRTIEFDDYANAWLYFYARIAIHMGVDTPEVFRATGEMLNSAFEVLQLQLCRPEYDIIHAEEPRSMAGYPYSDGSYLSWRKPGDISATLSAKLETLSAHLRDLEAKRKRAASQDAVKLRTPSPCSDVQMPRFESNYYVGDDIEDFVKEPGALALRTLDFGFTDPSVRGDPNERYVIR